MPRMITDLEAQEHNRLYEEAWRLLRPEMLLQGTDYPRKPGFLATRKLRKAIRLFTKAVEINPSGWQSMWAIGKAYQRLGEHGKALKYFTEASVLMPTHADVLRESSISAAALHDGETAVRFAKAAVQLEPTNVGLISNLSIAYLVRGDAKAAQKEIERALVIAQNDETLRALFQLSHDAATRRDTVSLETIQSFLLWSKAKSRIA